MRPILLILTVLLCARFARAEEAPPPRPPAPAQPAPSPTVQEIAVLLRSTAAADRERGEVLLVRALREAPDRAGFLERLALALRVETVAPVATPAPASTPAADPAGTPQEEEPPPAPQAAAPPPAGGKSADESRLPAPGKPASPAVWTLRAWGVSVPAKEAYALRPEGAAQVESENGGLAEASGPTESAPKWAEAAQRATDAVPLGEGTFGLPADAAQSAHLGASLTYRCCLEESKGGAWAVKTDTIATGLSLRATKTPAGLAVEPIWVTVAQPVATEVARPAPGVDLELDRPDWSAARTRHVLPLTADRGAGFLVIPGLLPDEGRRLVLVLELRPK